MLCWPQRACRSFFALWRLTASLWRWMSVSPTELAVRFIDGGEINYTRRDQEDD